MREVVVAHAPQIQAATSIRSTVLQSSVLSLREHGHFEAWLKLIDPVYRETIIESLAPSWFPLAVGIAHYSACEALRLTNTEQAALGEAVGDRIQGSFLATLMKSARAAGFNPMVLLKQFDRLQGRLFQGGSVQVTQTGPKDVEIEQRSVELCRIPYFRAAFCGVVRAGIRFSGVRTAYVKPIGYSPLNHVFTMHASWV